LPQRISVTVGAALLLIARSSPAHSPARAVLLEPRTSSRFSSEIFARVRGELASSNIELSVLPAPEEMNGMDAVQVAGQGLDPDLVLLVQEHSEGQHRTEEIWLSDRLAQRVFVERIDAPPSDLARTARWIAVQAVELMRARVAESRISEPRPEPKPELAAVPPDQPLELPPAPHETDLEAGLGIGLLHGFHGLADTWVPMARVSVGLFESALSALPLALRARLSVGVGVERGIVSGARSADTRQSFGTLDVLVRFAPGAAVQPFLSLGGGVYTLDVKGDAAAPYMNHSRRTWSGQNTVGAGLSLAPFKALTLVADAALMDVWSETVVQFGSQNVIHQGAPIALFGVAASGVF
jgi:hypothetical protein